MTPEEQLAATQATILAQAIEAHQVTGAAVAQLTTLWRDDFVLSTDGSGRYCLLSKTGETPADLIKARLASPDFAHFLPRAASGTTTTPELTPEAKHAALVHRARAFGGHPDTGGGYVPLGR